jgi:hypothetical protein
MISWLQDHLLICPFKYLTGIDCPGCGFQRAVLLLLKGNIYESIVIYPPAIPIILFFIYLLIERFLKLDSKQHYIKKLLLVIACTIVIINYGFKIWLLHSHYKASAVAII